MNKLRNFIDICDFNQNRLISLSMKTSEKYQWRRLKMVRSTNNLCAAHGKRKSSTAYLPVRRWPVQTQEKKHYKPTFLFRGRRMMMKWLRAEEFDSWSRMNRNKRDYSISIMKGASHVTGKNIFTLLWLSQFPPVYIFIGCTAVSVRTPSLTSTNSISTYVALSKRSL